MTLHACLVVSNTTKPVHVSFSNGDTARLQGSNGTICTWQLDLHTVYTSVSHLIQTQGWDMNALACLGCFKPTNPSHASFSDGDTACLQGLNSTICTWQLICSHSYRAARAPGSRSAPFQDLQATSAAGPCKSRSALMHTSGICLRGGSLTLPGLTEGVDYPVEMLIFILTVPVHLCP